ncbi:MAG: aminoacyl-tRNA hydrolase [Peptococcaceae bacterium]|jgi:PTH1 family peptidyl-tRNA hydrolase|nr:aminoacyl-tRNA hydrolase [Peptococcaceae bacterium]
MKVITGLGNPGGQYAQSRHNIGFVLADILADRLKLDFQAKFQGLLAEGRWQGERIFFFKPMTYMNVSGRALRELLRFYKIPSEQVLVVHDDLDLPVGRIRLRQRGSAGGHNGVRSVIGELGTEEFWRLKIGIDRPPAGWETVRYVLAPFRPEEDALLDESLGRAEAAAKLWLDGETTKAMNLYNRV